jgi:hypothetical protein
MPRICTREKIPKTGRFSMRQAEDEIDAQKRDGPNFRKKRTVPFCKKKRTVPFCILDISQAVLYASSPWLDGVIEEKMRPPRQPSPKPKSSFWIEFP